jgi:hypothetical protein
MGYSASREAFRTLEALDVVCRKHSGMSNVWDYKGKRYMYEIDRKDQKDDGIKGDVSEFVGETSAKRLGKFHVDGDGIIVKFPGWPEDVLPKPKPHKFTRLG